MKNTPGKMSVCGEFLKEVGGEVMVVVMVDFRQTQQLLLTPLFHALTYQC